MQHMKILELKSIDILGVFKFFGGIFLIVGLIIGLFANLLRINIMSPDLIRILPFMAKFGPGIFAGIAFGVIYGLSAGIGFSISALLYNFFAALFGGLRFSVEE